MSDDPHTSGDQDSATRKALARWGRGLVILGIILSAALLVWMEYRSWRQVGELRSQLASTDQTGPDVALVCRADLLRLNSRLLLFQLSGDAEEREAFHRESRNLRNRVERARSEASSAVEKDLLQRIAAALEGYLERSATMLERGVRGIRRDTAGDISRELSALSDPLFQLCDELLKAERSARQSASIALQASTSRIKRLLQFSLISGLSLLIFTVGLVYRVLISPLRSQLSQSQALIERQEKLASLGTLAAGVAHEIRNPLTAIKFRLFSLRKSHAGQLADSEDLQVIGDEINRLERIVKDFLQFARPSKSQLSNTSSQQILEEVYSLLKAQLEKQRIHFSIEPGEPIELQADKEQIKQVLINLIQNATDSIEQGGSIQLRARQGGSRLVKGSKPMVALEVIDSGKGIPANVQSRLFDPFFSTKEGGTGLGLPIAARIVEQHGGYIQYQTVKNRGTTFSVLLPRMTDHAAPNITH